MAPETVFTPLAEKMTPVLFTPLPVAVCPVLMALVRVMPPVSQRAAPPETAAFKIICPEPSALALLICTTPLTIVVVPVRVLLFAVMLRVPRSFFWMALIAALKVNGVSSVAVVPVVTSMPAVAALRRRVRPVRV